MLPQDQKVPVKPRVGKKTGGGFQKVLETFFSLLSVGGHLQTPQVDEPHKKWEKIKHTSDNASVSKEKCEERLT